MRASVERGLLEVAIPFMEDLYEQTHETVHLGVLQDTEVVYVSKIGGHHQASSPSRVGGRMPLYCTAIGKVLLANSGRELLSAVIAEGLERKTPRTIAAAGRLYKHLETVLETGVAFEYEESAMGLVCVAAAVLNSDEKPMGAISVAGPATRFQPEKHTTSVKAAAAGIADTLARSATLSTT